MLIFKLAILKYAETGMNRPLDTSRTSTNGVEVQVFSSALQLKRAILKSLFFCLKVCTKLNVHTLSNFAI